MPTLDQAKAHLRVDQDLDNAAIQAMLDAAKQAVAHHLDTTVENMELLPSPAPVHAAILLLTADLYDNRSLQADKGFYTNRTYERLLAPYRKVML